MAEGDIHPCEACGEPVVQPRTSRKRFCSKQCRGRGRYWPEPKWTHCEECGVELPRAGARRCSYCKGKRMHGPPKPSSTEYRAVHNRLAKIRGRASAHACIDCGEPAKQWSYNHSGIDEVAGTTHRGVETTWSLDLDQYDPMCTSCHGKRDYWHAMADPKKV